MNATVCIKCGKKIAGEKLECTTCRSVFHPSCCALHLRRKNVNLCCRVNLSPYCNDFEKRLVLHPSILNHVTDMQVDLPANQVPVVTPLPSPSLTMPPASSSFTSTSFSPPITVNAPLPALCSPITTTPSSFCSTATISSSLNPNAYQHPPQQSDPSPQSEPYEVVPGSVLGLILNKVNNIDKLIDNQNRYAANLEDFTNYQRNINNSVTQRLDVIPNLLVTLQNHEERLALADAQNAALATQIGALTSVVNAIHAGNSSSVTNNSSASTGETSTSSDSSDPSVEIIISGIPAQVTAPMFDVLSQIFNALEVTEHLPSILDCKKITKRSGQGTFTNFFSFIVRIKTKFIRDHIMEKRRAKGTILNKDVFFPTATGSIYVNEMLPPSVYSLYRKTKLRATALHYKYSWQRAGNIFVKKEDGSESIRIQSESDLDALA